MSVRYARACSDGKSYERAAITKYWEKAGRPISPITREELPSRALVPNLNLREVCASFKQKHLRVRAAASDPAEIVMSALLAPPPAPSPAELAAARKDAPAAGRAGSGSRLASKRPRRGLGENGAAEHEAGDAKAANAKKKKEGTACVAL